MRSRYVNAADAKYDPTPERPSRLHNAWRDMQPGWELRLPYGGDEASERYRLPEASGPLVIDKRYVTISGDGPNGYGVIANNANADAIEVRVSTVQIRDLSIGRYFWREVPEGAPANKGSGCGIVTRNTEPIGGLVLDRVSIEYQGDSGIAFRGIYQVSPILTDVNVYGCGGTGIDGVLVTDAEADVSVTACGGAGLALTDSAGGHWRVTNHSHKGPHQVALHNCDSIWLHGWFEDFSGREGLLLDECESCSVGGFFGAYGSSTSIRLRNGAVGNELRVSRHYGHPDTPHVTDGGDTSVRGNVVMPQVGAEVRVNSRRNRLL